MKRPQLIPKPVREAIKLMVYGKPDDPDGRPLTFIETAPVVGVKPDTLRRYLDKPAVIALLRRERRAFRESLCAGNESALGRVRDTAENAMAVVASVRQLEAMNADDATRQPGEVVPQRFAINIVTRIEPATAEGRSVPAARPPYLADREAYSPAPPAEIEAIPEPAPAPEEPIFKWRRP